MTYSMFTLNEKINLKGRATFDLFYRIYGSMKIVCDLIECDGSVIEIGDDMVGFDYVVG